MADDKRIDEATGTRFVGHEWDGIEELDTPMPRWWLWTFYASIVFAIGYCIAYPAWPLMERATAGVLGWTSEGELAAEMARERTRSAGVLAEIARTPAEKILSNPRLLRVAEEGGRSAFKMHCVQCHGSGAAGSAGYPNLNDDDWLWGGDVATIERTIQHGIRQPGDDGTRMSMMPAFGKDGILTAANIDDVVSHVRVISGQERPSAASRRGVALFAANCAACHGDGGQGNRSFGAPSLTDPIWLYGGDRDAITRTVTNARYGIMPAWAGRLDPATIRMLAVYVHSLGGGEATPAPTPTPSPAPGNGQPE
jgi:cytochrome c oxidase cbb3-type subunit 3